MIDPQPPSPHRHWRRAVWGAAGVVALATGIVGAFLPLLPTTPFVLLSAFCFSRSSPRLERWLLEHPRFGPLIRDWRANRAIPLRAKWTAWVMMAIGSAWAAWLMPAPWAGVPALCCAAVAFWMWRLPSRPAELAAAGSSPKPATGRPPADPPI